MSIREEKMSYVYYFAAQAMEVLTSTNCASRQQVVSSGSWVRAGEYTSPVLRTGPITNVLVLNVIGLYDFMKTCQ